MRADADGEPVKAQIVPVSNATADLQAAMLAAGILPSMRAAASHELVFIAHVPPLGYTSFTVAPASEEQGPQSGSSASPAQQSTQRAWLGGRSAANNASEPAAVLELSTGALRLNVSTATGRVLALADARSSLAATLNTEARCPTSSRSSACMFSAAAPAMHATTLCRADPVP